MKWLGIAFPERTLLQTVRRFPLSVLCCLTLFVIVAFSREAALFEQGSKGLVQNLAALSIPLFFWFGGARLFAESHQWGRAKEFGLAFLGGGIVAGIFLTADNTLMTWPLLAACAILFLMGAPVVGRRHDGDEFWAFNSVLWMGAVLAFCMALVLFLGLLAAIAAADALLRLSMGSDLYKVAFAFCTTLFAPLYAMFWLQDPAAMIDPKLSNACRILLRYILLPLTVIYFAIVYFYGATVLATWSLPADGLAFTALCACGFGLVTWLMAWPLRDGGQSFETYHRHFFKALIVPLLLVAVSIGRRVADYGITEPRYYVLLALAWFAGIAAVYMVRPRTPLFYIPLTLAALVVLSCAGPWGAAAVTTYSQTARLEKILTARGILQDGRVVMRDDVVFSEDERKAVVSVVQFLIDTRRSDELPEGLMATAAREGDKVRLLGFDLAEKDRILTRELKDSVGKNFNVGTIYAYNEATAFDVSGFDYFVTESNGRGIFLRAGEKKTIAVGGQSWDLTFDGTTISIAVEGQVRHSIEISGAVRALLRNKADDRRGIALDSDQKPSVRVVVQGAEGYTEGEKLTINQVSFHLLARR